jgi:YYY domain-containing protein
VSSRKPRPARKAPKAPLRRTRRAAEEDEPNALMLWLDSVLENAKAAWQALRHDRTVQIFAAVLLLGLLARLVRPDWYGDRQFHPDERWLFQKTAQISWPMEPGADDSAGLQYGSLPLYLVGTVKDVAHIFSPRMDNNQFVISAGRTLTGLIDTLTILFLFLLGAKLYNRKVGLLAAVFLACTPLHIQLSHFFTVDPYLGLFSVATLYACAGVLRHGTWGWSLAAGLFYGFALSSKSSGLPLALPIVLAHAFRFLEGERDAESLKQQAIHLGYAVLAAFVAFALTMPWALLKFDKFLRNQNEQQNILVKGSPEGTPFVRQYWDTMPVFFHLKNLVLYYQGPVLGALGLAAFLAAWVRFIGFGARLLKPPAATAKTLRKTAPSRARSTAPSFFSFDPGALLVLAWITPYLLIVGFSFAKFARYMIPFSPFVALLAAALLMEGLERLQGMGRKLAKGLLIAAVAYTALYGAAYVSTYFKPHPWIDASRWMFANIPTTMTENGQTRRTVILNETWADDLPVNINGKDAGAYQNWQINIVEWDSLSKLRALADHLEKSDVLIMADPRGYGTYLRLSNRFPLTYAYYHLLMSDPKRLGFELAYQSKNPARLLGLSNPDSRTLDQRRLFWADESWTLYDRPHAFIFRKKLAMPQAALSQLLEAHVVEMGLSMGWKDGMGPEELQRLSKGQKGVPSNSASAIAKAQSDSKPNPNLGLSRGGMLPLGPAMASPIVWWLLLMVLTVLAAPISAAVFSAFPDKGWALAKPMGLLLFAYLAFQLSVLKVFRFHQIWLWALLLALAAFSFTFARRRREALSAWWQAHRTEVLTSEAVFAAAFFFFIWVKLFNPNIHDIAGQGYNGGGEPLGMTYLSALTRCATFPAFDPWLAGASSSYYYFGYLLAATLTKLSGQPPAVTYNLSLALFFALAVSATYGLGRALTGRRGFGMLGAAVLAGAGTLWAVPFLVNTAVKAANNVFAQVFRLGSGFFTFQFMWDPTRFPDLVNGLIFETPYFSYLYGDLHPHNMVVAFAVVYLALMAKPFLSPETGLKALGETWPRRLMFLWMAALFLDAQFAINTWNWPVALATGLAAWPFALWVGRKGDWRSRTLHALLGVALSLGVALLGFVQMFLFRSYFKAATDSPGHVVPSEWTMPGYLLFAYFGFGFMGLFLIWALRFKGWVAAQEQFLKIKVLAKRGPLKVLTEAPKRLWQKRPVFTVLLAVALASLLVSILSGLVFSRGAIWIMGLGLAAFSLLGLVLCADTPSPKPKEEPAPSTGPEAYAFILVFGVMCVVAGTEFFFVADRMNTIFKFFFMGWVMMALVFAMGVARLHQALKPEAPAPAARKKPAKILPALPAVSRLGKGLVLAFAAFAVLALLVAIPKTHALQGVRSIVVHGLLWSGLAGAFILPFGLLRHRGLPLGFGVLGLLGSVFLLFAAAWQDYYYLPSGGRYQFSFLVILLMMALPVAALWVRQARVRAAALGAVAALAGLGLMYFVGASVARTSICSDTYHVPARLNGLAFMGKMERNSSSDYDADDFALISYLNKQADRTETLLEAPGREMYRGFTRMSIYTGLPTVVGWEYQIGQQLGRFAGNRISERDLEVGELYSTVNEERTWALIKKYQVRWIVVGGIERRNYPGPGLEKFGRLFTEAARSGASVIYKVKEGA